MPTELVKDADIVGAAAPGTMALPRACNYGLVFSWAVLGGGSALLFCLNALSPEGVRFIGLSSSFLGIPAARLLPLAALVISAIAFAMLVRRLGLLQWTTQLPTTLTLDRRRWSALAIAVGVALSLIAVWVLRGFPNSGDEYAYLFEAKTFLAGRLWNPLPPVPELFSSFRMTFLDSKWFAPYPPGWPLLLMGGMSLGFPAWVVCPLAGGVLLLAVLKLADRRDGVLGGLVAVALVALSPFFIFNAGSYFYHVPAAAAGLLFCWAASVYLDRPQLSSACLAGLALGALGLIRPFDVPIFAAPFAVEFIRRAGRKHYRLAPAIVLAGLPFLAILLLYYLGLSGSPLPNARESAAVQFGLWAIDPHGHQLTPIDQLGAALVRVVGIAEWSSPLLVLGFGAAFVWLAARRRLSFIDVVPLAFVAAYMLVPYDGANQYGPRYYFEAFPFLVLTFVSGIAPLLRDTTRPNRAGFAWVLLFAHVGICIAGVAIIGSWMRFVVDQRMDIYDQVRAKGLHNAVVVVHSGTGYIAPMEPRDLTRNGIDPNKEPVIYVLDLPARLPELKRGFPQRPFYIYDREAGSPTGTLHPLRRLDRSVD